LFGVDAFARSRYSWIRDGSISRTLDQSAWSTFEGAVEAVNENEDLFQTRLLLDKIGARRDLRYVVERTRNEKVGHLGHQQH
jgi:hypothetical protein